MDGRVNNKGTKGNKGRPSLVIEHTRSLVINKSWERLLKLFEKKDVNEKQLDTIALEIAKKTIPQNIDFTSKGEQIAYTESQINAIIERYNRSRKD